MLYSVSEVEKSYFLLAATKKEILYGGKDENDSELNNFTSIINLPVGRHQVFSQQ